MDPNNQTNQPTNNPAIPGANLPPASPPTPPPAAPSTAPTPVAPPVVAAPVVPPTPVVPTPPTPAEPAATAPAPSPVPPTAPAGPEPAPVQPSTNSAPAASSGATKPNHKPSPALIGIIIAVTAVLVIGIIIVVLLLTGVIGASDPTPTPELAKSVCEKYGGELRSASDDSIQSDDYISAYICDNLKDYSNHPDTAFLYQISFASEDSLAEYWEQVHSIADNENNSRTVLENSDTFIKLYGSDTSLSSFITMHEYIAMYKNAMIIIESLDVSLAESLLAELGFPDRSHADAANSSTSSEDQTAPSQEQLNATYQEALSSLYSGFLTYQTNHQGQLPSIEDDYVYADGTGSTDLDQIIAQTINSPEAAPDEPYTVQILGSFADSMYAEDTSELTDIPNDFIYGFYGATCSDENTVTASANLQDIALVHSNADNSAYFCVGSTL